MQQQEDLYEDMVYDIEISTGTTAVDNHCKSVDLPVQPLPEECKTFYFIRSAEEESSTDRERIFCEYEHYCNALQNEATWTDPMVMWITCI